MIPHSYRLFILAIALPQVMCGCASMLHARDTTPGDSIEITRTFGFVFQTDGNRYADIPVDAAKQVIQDGASWQSSDGVSLEGKNIEVTRAEVEWDPDGMSKSSVVGLKVRTSCVAKIDQSVKPGDMEIRLDLPGIAKLGEASRVKPLLKSVSDSEHGDLASLSPDEVYTSPSIYQVQRLTVYGSSAQKYFSTVMKWVVVAVAFILIMLIGYSARQRLARGGN